MSNYLVQERHAEYLVTFNFDLALLTQPDAQALYVLSFYPGRLLTSSVAVFLHFSESHYVGLEQTVVDGRDVEETEGCEMDGDYDEDDCLLRSDAGGKNCILPSFPHVQINL